MEVRPFKLVNRRECGEIAEKLRHALADWAGSWFAADSAVTLEANDLGRCVFDAKCAPESWALAGDHGRWLTCQANTEARRRIASALGGESVRLPLSPMVDALVDACLGDLCGRILNWDAKPDASPQPAVTSAPLAVGELKPGSGAARLCVMHLGEPFDLVISPALARSLTTPAARPGRQVTLHRRSECLGKQRVRASITAGDAELSLAELSSLAVGHVLRLDREHQGGFDFSLGKGKLVAKALLGRRGPGRAIRLRSVNE